MSLINNELLRSWGCGLYTSAAYTRVFTVTITCISKQPKSTLVLSCVLTIAGLAHLVKRLNAEQEVVGSIPCAESILRVLA